MTKDFLEADVTELTKLIKEHAKVPAAKGGPETRGVKETFCEVWPGAKSGLTLLKSIIGSIPGVSFFAKAAVDVVIAAGAAAVSALCNQ